MEKETGGKRVKCEHGYIDIVTETEFIVIREWKNFYNAFGKAMCYKMVLPDRTARIHFYGKKPKVQDKIHALNAIIHHGITVSSE